MTLTNSPSVEERSSEGSLRQAHWNRSTRSERAATPDSEESAIRTLDAARELAPKIRSATVHASTACTRAVELLHKANGGSSVYTGNALDRCRRDIQTANQHVLVSFKTWEVTDRVLLGLEHNYGLLF